MTPLWCLQKLSHVYLVKNTVILSIGHRSSCFRHSLKLCKHANGKGERKRVIFSLCIEDSLHKWDSTTFVSYLCKKKTLIIITNYLRNPHDIYYHPNSRETTNIITTITHTSGQVLKILCTKPQNKSKIFQAGILKMHLQPQVSDHPGFTGCRVRGMHTIQSC